MGGEEGVAVPLLSIRGIKGTDSMYRQKKTKLNIQLVNYIEYSRPKLEMKHIGNPERYPPPPSFLFLFVLCNEVSPSICGNLFRAGRGGFMAHNKVDDERIEKHGLCFLL